MPTTTALVRAAHAGPCVAVTLAAALLAVAGDAPASTVLLVAAAVLTGQLTIGWSNDLVDLPRDRAVGRTDKPLVAGDVTPATVRTATAAALAACVALSLACGLSAGGVHLLAVVGSGWAYNLRLKATAWSWAPYALAFGGLPVVAGLARSTSDLPWWVAVTGALVGVGAHLVNVVPDLADDAATGVRGLPHRLGARTSVAVAVVLLVGAWLVVVLGSAGGVGPVDVAGLLVVAAAALVAVRGHGRAPFVAAMVVALVDVALLAWSLR